jgi:rhamnose transport system ATP-binding protein
MQLELIGIDKTYGAVRALDGVSLELESGRVSALVGENGAGKSTLIGVLGGLVAPDAGRIRLEGRERGGHSARDARRLGIAVVHQVPRLFAELSVAENLLFARGGFLVSRRRREVRARRMLERVGAQVDPRTPAKELSPAQQQLVALARVLDLKPRLLVLDEPTAVLPAVEARDLVQRITDLGSEGVAVLYVSHRLDEVLRLADDITVLRDGRVVWQGAAAGVNQATLVTHMAGRAVEGREPARAKSIGRPRLELRSLSARAAGLRDIDLAVRAGEILGLAGLGGAGRTKLLGCLVGIAPCEAGDLGVVGRRVPPLSPRRAVSLGIAHLAEDRRRRGVIGPMSVAQNLSLSRLATVTRRGLIDTRAEQELAETLVARFGVRTSSAAAALDSLSGGNQQKVALARILADEPRVLLLDEPTQGIDVAGRAEIHRMIQAQAARGAAILLASSDLDEVLSLSDRVGVMRQGRIVATLDADTDDATLAERVLGLALGLPAATVAP